MSLLRTLQACEKKAKKKKEEGGTWAWLDNKLVKNKASSKVFTRCIKKKKDSDIQ